MPLIIIISSRRERQAPSICPRRLSQLFCSLYIRAHLKVTETKRFRRAAEKLFDDGVCAWCFPWEPALSAARAENIWPNGKAEITAAH